MNIEQIIRTYFNSHFSEATRRKFAWWLVNSSDDEKAKDAAMERLWEESIGRIDMQTLNDLEGLRSKMKNKDNGPSLTTGHRNHWLAAAAIALIALTALTTYLIHGKLMTSGDEFVHISVPNGRTQQLFLEDSTSVTINAGTTLIYPRHFSKDKRNVFLIGEANFDVTKDAKRPFTVETQSLNVTALGTKFDVQAYSDARTVSTTLEEGRTQVEIVEPGAKTTGMKYLMTPNQNLTYNRGTGEVALTEVNASRRLSWEKGNLIFEGDDFKTIMQALERKYNVTIICEHTERMEGKYYVKFQADESLTDALDILNKLSHHFTYKQEEDIVYITPVK